MPENLPYLRSRSANRQLFGSRAIDASAPYAAGKGPVSNMPGTMGGKTPVDDWRRFFDRGAPLVSGYAQGSEMDKMFMASGTSLATDPSQSFRMAGTPPIGGPVTAPMPTTPTAMQYFQEGIKGAQAFIPGLVGPGDQFKGSGTDFARVTTGTNALTARGQNPEFLEFLKRYRRA